MSRKKHSSTQKKRHPNVSERLRNHIQNRSLAEMYASLFEHNPDSIISLNLEGVILHINPSAERILGYTSNELERKTITSILEAHISDQVLQYIKNAAADNQKEYIVSIYHKDGYLLDAVTKLVPIFVKNRLTGVYAIMKPLEKSERIEKVLQESEKRLRTLMNSMPAFVIFKDHEGRWLEANDYALSCFNFHNVPYHGKRDNELIQYNEAYRESFLHCEEVDELTWQKGQILHGEEFIIHRNDFDLVLSISKSHSSILMAHAKVL